MTFYQQFDLKNLTIQTGVSSITFIDYVNLEERNKLYFFSSLKANEYLVFAEQTGGGNPVLFNFQENTSTPAIYAAYDILEPFKIADNFHQFIEALTALIDIVYNDYDIYEIYTTDDCDEIKPAFFPSINMRLSTILGQNMENFMRYFFS